MPITNTSRVLVHLPYAIGAYGTGVGTPGVSVGTAMAVPVERFKPTPDSGFQATLYKDSVTGKYTVAFAGTNDATDALHPDRQLATANVLSAVGAGSWDPQVTDAIKFTTEAFRTIQADYANRKLDPPTLDDLRSMVTVTGHSLGGSLAELTAKFYGLSGANIDGPGTASLVGQSQWNSLQAEAGSIFTDFKTDYALTSSQFGAYAYTVVGVAGTHVSGIEVQRTPRAEAAEAAMFTAAGSMATANVPSVLLSAVVAFATAPAHPSTLILEETEALAGITPNSNQPVSPFSSLRIGEGPTLSTGSSTGTALGLQADAHRVQINVAGGVSPAGVPLDGTALQRGPYSVIAYRDIGTGRIVEVLTHLDKQGDASGAAPIRREYVVDASGRVGVLDESGNLAFIHVNERGQAGVVTLAPDGAIQMTSATGQTSSLGAVLPEVAEQMLRGEGGWVNTITDNLFAPFLGEQPPTEVSPPDRATDSAGAVSEELSNEQIDDLNERLGLSSAPAPGPGTHYADAASNDHSIVTDAGSGWRAVPPAEAPPPPSPSPQPAPVLTTLRVNANTVFTLNEDGDIVSETTTLTNGYTQIRDIAGNISYADADGHAYDAGQYQDLQIEQAQYGAEADGGRHSRDTGTGSSSPTPVTTGTDATNSLAVAQAILSLNHFNSLSTVQQLGALANLYNAGAQISGGSVTPINGTATSVLSFAAALESGNDGAIIVTGAQLGSQLFAETAVGSALSSAVPYLNMALALSNIEENPIGALSAALALIPGIGLPLSAFLTIGSALVGDDGPNVAVGHIQAGWDDAGQLSYTTLRDEEEGGREAIRTMAQLNEQLEAALVQDGRLGLVSAANNTRQFDDRPATNDMYWRRTA